MEHNEIEQVLAGVAGIKATSNQLGESIMDGRFAEAVDNVGKIAHQLQNIANWLELQQPAGKKWPE